MHAQSLNEPAKPFLKWAGGKTRLLPEIKKSFPKDFFEGSQTYVEPFAGSGAVFFGLVHPFRNSRKVLLNDRNRNLIRVYEVVQSNLEGLLPFLEEFQREYHALENHPEAKTKFFDDKRREFNLRDCGKVQHAALFIFLNRTCFNGLHRVNAKNNFNVPMGRYFKPRIFNEENLGRASGALKNVGLLSMGFERVLEHAGENALFYFDPPYKPVSKTSHFNSYTKEGFGDEEQVRLRDFCAELDRRGHQWILSNSDPKAEGSAQGYFDELYKGYHLRRVRVSRSINSNSEKRGRLSEVLITNF